MRALVLATLTMLLAAAPAAAACAPEAESRAAVVSHGRGPLAIEPGRLCADLGGPPPPAEVQIGVGIGDFGRGASGSLYSGDDTGRAPPPGAGPRRR